ncbi:MAG: phosphatase PAP2 family protein [Armatimonadetes bacterium]|nr:phosphatase PAP2 family protein [Armatimonadota bacterium]
MLRDTKINNILTFCLFLFFILISQFPSFAQGEPFNLKNYYFYLNQNEELYFKENLEKNAWEYLMEEEHFLNPPKQEIKIKKKFWENLNPKELFNFSNLFSELKDSDILSSAVIFSFLMENDRSFYNNFDQRLKRPTWEKFSHWYTYLGEGFVDMALSGAVYLFSKDAKNKEIAQMGIEAVALTGVQIQVLKRFFGVPRPAWERQHLGFSWQDDALPSGHTATAFALATVMGQSYNLEWLTYPLAALVGITRISEHAHWPSDNFLGALLGHLAGRRIMINHGYLEPNNSLGKWRFGNTHIEVKGNLENYWDDNPTLSLNSQNDRLGNLWIFSNISRKLNSNILWQGAYQYQRQIYNRIQNNNLENHLIENRFSFKINPKTILHLSLNFKDFKYPDIQNQEHYLYFYGSRAYEGGITRKLNSKVFSKFKYQIKEMVHEHFSNLDALNKKISLGLAFYPDLNLNWEVNYQHESNPAKNLNFSYQADNLTGGLNYSLSWGKISLFYNQNQRKFPDFYINQEIRQDRFNEMGINIQKNFSKDFSLAITLKHFNSQSNDLNYNYNKNLYGIEFKKEF